MNAGSNPAYQGFLSYVRENGPLVAKTLGEMVGAIGAIIKALAPVGVEVLKVVGELADEGWTMAIVTHELAFARAVADTVSFFDHGVVVEQGTPEQLFDDPRSERLQRFLRRLTDPLA